MIEFEKFLRKRYSETYLNEIFNPNISKALILETYRGDVVIELFHKDVSLVKEVIARALLGEYDGMTFHNCNPFFVQMRKNTSDIEGKPKQVVPYLKNLKGTVGLVNSKKNTNNSLLEHLYICLKDVPEFDGKYTVIGKVVKGLNVLNKVWDGNTVKAVYITKNYSKKQGVGNGLNLLFWAGLILALFYFLRFFSDKIQSLKTFEESLFGKDLTSIVPKPYDLVIIIASVLFMLLAVVIAPLARKLLEKGVETQFKKVTSFKKKEELGQQKVKTENGAKWAKQEESAKSGEESREVALKEQKIKLQEELKKKEREKKAEIEEERKKAEPAEKKRAEVDALKKKLEEEIERMQKEREKLEEVKKYERLKKEIEEKTKKQEEELKKKLAEEERKRRTLEETNKQEEGELKKKQESDNYKRQLDEEKKKKKLEEIEKKEQAEEEKRRKKLEEEMNKKTLELERKLEQEKRKVEKEEERKRKIKEEMFKKQEEIIPEDSKKEEHSDLERQQFVGKMGADSGIKEKLKDQDKQKIKQEVLPQIAKRTETHLDVLYDLLEKYNLLKLSYIMKTFGIEKEEALEWCNILVEHGLAELNYPAFGEPSLKKKS